MTRETELGRQTEIVKMFGMFYVIVSNLDFIMRSPEQGNNRIQIFWMAV